MRAQFQRCGAASKVWEGEPGRLSESPFWLLGHFRGRGSRIFMAAALGAALPKVPVRALKLGDRISPTGAARGQAIGIGMRIVPAVTRTYKGNCASRLGS